MRRFDVSDPEERAAFFDQCLLLLLAVALFTATVAALTA